MPLYLLLAENTRPADLEQKINLLLQAYPVTGTMHLQRLTDIHLHSHLQDELAPNGDIRYVYIFSAAALLILLIACINFINLATARSLHRSREVGVRKVMGAHWFQLAWQFLVESFISFFLALGLALLLVELGLPFFNQLIGKTLLFSFLLHPTLLLLVAGLFLTVCILAGAYPALYLSGQNPVFALKGVLRASTLNARMRQVLVVVQFSISVVLIVATVVIYNQLHYISSKKLGFDKEQLLVIPQSYLGAKGPSFKQELLRHSGVEGVTLATWHPGAKHFSRESSLPDPHNPKTSHPLYYVDADLDFIKTLKIEMVEGRDFSPEMGRESGRSEALADSREKDTATKTKYPPIVINEAALKLLDIPSPVGLDIGLMDGHVIGVVKDFHGLSLHQEVPPVVLLASPTVEYGHTIIRVRPGEIPSTLAFLEKQWKTFYPEVPLAFYFLDDYLQRLYTAEQLLGKLFMAFALFGIGIACLGLLGLASFVAEQRTKEIGIRKVLGASVHSIVNLLSKDFVKLVLLANLLSWPVAWYGMSKWLEDFAYRIDLEWWVFALAGGLALLIALLTVSYQAVKAALMNPVKSLRSE